MIAHKMTVALPETNDENSCMSKNSETMPIFRYFLQVQNVIYLQALSAKQAKKVSFNNLSMFSVTFDLK